MTKHDDTYTPDADTPITVPCNALACKLPLPEPWRVAWRDGIQPQISLFALHALRDALATNDPHLMQGVVCQDMTTWRGRFPDEPSRGLCACAIGYAGLASGAKTVGAVEEWFNDVVQAADYNLDKNGGHLAFLDWFDAESREEVFTELLGEVEEEIERRTFAIRDTPDSSVAVA